MVQWLFLGGIAAVAGVFSSKLLSRLGIPTLLLFLLAGVGMGMGDVQLMSYDAARNVCSVALVFVLFHSGFNLKLETAKPVITRGVLLSTLGVVVTSAVTGLLLVTLAGMGIVEAILLGVIVSGVDGAAICLYLKSRGQGLKNGLVPLAKIEGGMGGAVACVLAFTMTGISEGITVTPLEVGGFVLKQIFFAALIGGLVAFVAVMLLKRDITDVSGLYPLLTAAFALVTYSAAEIMTGNGFLAVYILGAAMGNSKFANKSKLTRSFEGAAWVSNLLLFFTMGMLAQPSQLAQSAVPAAVCLLALILLARPLSSAISLAPFKTPLSAQVFSAFAAPRGAVPITLAVYALTAGVTSSEAVFSAVFCVCVFSAAVQGTLVPVMAKGLKLTEENNV